jgi:holo-[acyl-carrier protein] synthase
MRLLGHGIDLVEVSRIQRMLAEHQGRMLEKLFTPAEQAECRKDVRTAARFAARFAAKEAAMKALGTGLADGVSWTDIGVLNDPAGAPSLVITGRAAELAAKRGITSWSLSLTHTDEYAAASVLAMG